MTCSLPALRTLWLSLSAAFILLVSFSGAAAAQSADGRIWDGVFTAAQAARGKSNFTTSCERCHGANLAGVTAPSLTGPRFMTAWENEPVYRLFTKVRDTMPPNFGTTLTDEAKLDVVAYILQSNGFPAGTTELAMGADALEGIQIARKGQGTVLPNFSVVQVVGCLAPGPNSNVWLLTSASEPAATKDQPSSPDELKLAETQPLGSISFRLVNTNPFKSSLRGGQKVEAKGLLYRDPEDSRLNLTSLQTVASLCSK